MSGVTSPSGVNSQVAHNTGDISVTRTDSVQAPRLASLYRQSIPEKLHVVRDAEYYRWRLGGPSGSWIVYVATRGTEDVGALVAQPRTMDGGTTRIDVSETLPLGKDDREAVFGALLDRIIADNRSVDLFVDPSGALPNEVLRDRGFVSSARPPLSWMYSRVGDPLTLFALSLTNMEFDIGDDGNWEVNDLTRNTN